MQKFLSISEKSFFWVVLFLVVFIPLYPKFPLMNVNGTFVAIRVEDIMIAIALGWWAIYIYFSKQVTKILSNRLNQALILFFFIGGISLFSGIFLTKTISLNLAIFHFLRRIELMMLLPVAYQAIISRKQIKLLLITLSMVLFIANLYALGQKYLGWPVISTNNSEFSKGLILYLSPDARVSSTFAGHYDFAIYLAVSIVIISALIFTNKKLLVLIWQGVLLCLSFFTLVLTAARLSFAAVLMGIVVSLLLSGKRLFIFLVIGAGIIVLIYPSQLRDRLISTVTINILQEGDRYTAETDIQEERSQLNIPTLPHEDSTDSAEMVKTTGIPSDITPGEPTDYSQMAVYRSSRIRFYYEWPRAIRAFIKNPFLGTGYSSLGLATDNDFLRSLGEVGLLGTIAFFLILVEITKIIWSNFRFFSDKLLRYFSIGLLSMIVVLFINSMFIDVFEASKIATLFWIIAGVGVSMEKLK